MLRGFSKVIDQAASMVPAVLWSGDAMRAMKAVVARFPEVKAKTIGPVRLGIIGLELRLAPDAGQVDLCFPILREDRDVIVALAADETDGAWLREDPTWSGIARFCSHWADPASLAGQYVDLLWFELDVDGEERGGIPVPGVCIALKPEATKRLDPDGWCRLLDEVVEPLTGAPAHEATSAHFRHAMESVPPEAVVRFFGLMLSRGAGPVRFLMGDVPEKEMPSFLRTIGWPGEADALAAGFAELRTREGRLVRPGLNSIQYDVYAGRVLPRLGLECTLDRDGQTENGIRELEFLDALVERGLCGAEKRDALLCLPGETVEPHDGICLLGHARQVHHVKLVADPEGFREAKAYYGRALAVRPLPGTAPRPAGAPVHAAV
jgi:hypothetical protein